MPYFVLVRFNINDYFIISYYIFSTTTSQSHKINNYNTYVYNNNANFFIKICMCLDYLF